MRDFKKLKIWEKGMEIVVELYRLTATFPKSEKYGMTSQMRRSAISIPSNISEGSSRNSEKDQYRFLEIALGSAFELETQVIASGHLKFISLEDAPIILQAIRNEQRMISSFMSKLNFKR